MQEHLRQLGIALIIHTHNNAHYPAREYLDTSISRLMAYGWPAHMLPYTSSNTTVFRCPSTGPEFEGPTNHSPRGYPFPFNIDIGTSRFSHGYNQWGFAAFSGYGLEAPPGAEVPESRVVNPPDMIALGDSDGNGLFDGDIAFHRIPSPSGPKPTFPPGNRHKSGANIVFCDGHVEWARQSK
ncbi:H-X9-DG-CTERM domain-containing protein [Limisphaera ngatamarikiensis]|nr:H-X9-DG-CTERM domain-containing protein [Limisphaera ngatamarikiensis]